MAIASDTDSVSYSEDEEEISEQRQMRPRPQQKKKPLSKVTDFFCGIIDYFLGAMTITYNIIWIYLFKHISSSDNYSEFSLNNEKKYNCETYKKFKEYILFACIFNLTKGFLYFSVSKCCCGISKDLKVFCIIIKGCTGFLVSLIFIFKTPAILKEFNLEQNKDVFFDSIKNECSDLENYINLFYVWEFVYGVFCIFAFISIFSGVSAVMMKECWKGRGYRVR